MRSILLRPLAFVALCAAIVAAPAPVVATVESDGGPTPSFLKVVGNDVFFALYDEATAAGRSGRRTARRPARSSCGRGSVSTSSSFRPATGSSSRRAARSGRATGRPTGTTVVAELPFYPNGIKRIDDDVFFSDGRGQLWRSDLTAPGTTLLKDIPPGFLFHDLTPAAITNVSGFLFFRAVDAVHGSELWFERRDAGRHDPHRHQSVPRVGAGLLREHQHPALLQRQRRPVTATSSGKSDGTAAGTDDSCVTSIRSATPGRGTSAHRRRRVLERRRRHQGAELWRSDGTEAGTVAREGHQSRRRLVPERARDVDGTLFFRADDGVHGLELWRSDGTEAGTTLVRDVHPTGAPCPRTSGT